jgi:cardiolipin synthase A/B
MLIDDVWATVGSSNLHRFSLFGNGELNAAISAPEAVRGFRIELFKEHLGQDTALLDDRAALRLFRQIAHDNRQKLDHGDPVWQGLAFALDATTYGRSSQI